MSGALLDSPYGRDQRQVTLFCTFHDNNIQLSANGVSVPVMSSSQWPPVHVPHAMPQHTTSNTSSTYRALSYAQGSSRQRILRATGRPLAARCSTREQQGHSTMWPRLRPGSVVSQAPLHANGIVFLFSLMYYSGSQCSSGNVWSIRMGRDGIPFLLCCSLCYCIHNKIIIMQVRHSGYEWSSVGQSLWQRSEASTLCNYNYFFVHSMIIIFSSVQMASVFQLCLQANGHLCTCHMQCLSTLLATPPQPTGHCHMPRAAPGMGCYKQLDSLWQIATLAGGA